MVRTLKEIIENFTYWIIVKWQFTSDSLNRNLLGEIPVLAHFMQRLPEGFAEINYFLNKNQELKTMRQQAAYLSGEEKIKLGEYILATINELRKKVELEPLAITPPSLLSITAQFINKNRDKVNFFQVPNHLQRLVEASATEERPSFPPFLDQDMGIKALCLIAQLDFRDQATQLHSPNFNLMNVACMLGNAIVVSDLLQLGVTPEQGTYENLSSLHLAVKYGHCEVVSLLIAHGANLDIVVRSVPGYRDRYTALHFAAQQGSLPLCKLLINGQRSATNPDAVGASINVVAEYNKTPLFLATEEGHSEVVEYLIANGADLSIVGGSYGHNCFHIACGCGHASIVKIIVENINTLFKPSMDEDKNAKALREKFSADSLERMKKIFWRNEKFFPEWPDKDNNTPLISACSYWPDYSRGPLSLAKKKFDEEQHKEIVKFLLDAGANILAKSDDESTPITAACSAQWYSIIQLLIDKGADLNEMCDGATAIFYYEGKDSESEYYDLSLQSEEHMKLLKVIYDKTLPQNLFTTRKESLLLEAATYGDTAGLKYLIKEKEMDPTVKDSKGNTLLHIAVREEHYSCVEYLVSEQPEIDIDALNAFGYTALHFAVKRENANVLLPLLLRHGANPNLSDKKGATPLLLITEPGKSELIDILLEKGATVDFSSDVQKEHAEMINIFKLRKMILEKDKKIVELEIEQRPIQIGKRTHDDDERDEGAKHLKTSF